ncbi:MAG: DUF1989 domain-containing protein [Cellulomonas sp.]|nr:DUF1989 domain-containing protein [Cellulomonas sp.]
MTLSTASLFAGPPAPPTIAWPAPPHLVDADLLVWAETVRDGACTSVVVASGTTVRLVDLDGNACAHLLVFNADEPAERLDVENTLRTPERLALTAGCRLLSGAGRTLATITHRSTGGHDASVSAADAALFARAVARHELATHPAPRSLAFFRAVSLADDGAPVFGGPVEPGASVTIRAELPLVVLVANAPHPLDPRPDATSGPVELLAWRDSRTSGATARHPASRGVRGSADRAARA